jgi:hypothetical protein
MKTGWLRVSANIGTEQAIRSRYGWPLLIQAGEAYSTLTNLALHHDRKSRCAGRIGLPQAIVRRPLREMLSKTSLEL